MNSVEHQNWRILRVHSGQEVAIARRLPVAAYVPQCCRSVFNRRNRAYHQRIIPLLPGYIFVLSTLDATLHNFAPSPHVIGFMREPDRSYSELSPRSFALLREVERRSFHPEDIVNRAGDISEPLPVAPQFAIGDIVSIRSLSIRAMVEQLESDRIFARMVGSNFRLSLKLEDAEPVAA